MDACGAQSARPLSKLTKIGEEDTCQNLIGLTTSFIVGCLPPSMYPLSPAKGIDAAPPAWDIEQFELAKH